MKTAVIPQVRVEPELRAQLDAVLTENETLSGHSPGVARGADATAFAGEGDKKVVPAIVATHPCKAVGKDAAVEVFAKSLLHISGRGVVVALAVELSGAGKLQPGREVFGIRAVQQGALGVTGVVGFRGAGGLNWLGSLSRLDVRSPPSQAG